MGIRNYMSNFLFKQAEKRGWLDDFKGSIRYGGMYLGNDEDALKESELFLIMQDISNQIVLANWNVENAKGQEQPFHPAIRILEKPNSYLTRSEFLKLMTNTYLIEGEVFPLFDGKHMHIATNVYAELTEQLTKRYTVGGTEIPTHMIAHIKNVGLNHLSGVGVSDLARDTLEGVLNAEKVLTDKYKKGGLLAFLLKLDAHINAQNAAQSMLINAILDQLESIDESRTVKLIPLGKGYNIDVMKSPIEDEKIMEYLRAYKKESGKFMGVDVDVYKSLMKSDVEKAMMYLHNKAVRPLLTNMTEHLTELLCRDGCRITAEINILDFVTYSTKTNIAYNLVRTMITTPDDARAMLGFDKLKTAESMKLYVSKDLVASEDLKNATENSLKGGERSAEET